MAQAAPFQIQYNQGDTWIFPDSVGLNTASIEFVLEAVGGSNGSPSIIDSGTFLLDWQGTDAHITMNDPNIWGTTDAERLALWTAFETFIQSLDALEADHSLVQGGARLVVAQTAAYLPLPLTELFLYYYGWVSPSLTFLGSAHKYVNLLPGMRIRLMYANYYEAQINSANFAAYSGSGSGYVYICSVAGSNKICFSPYLNTQQIQVAGSSGSPIRMAATALDLSMNSGVSEQDVYHRLFYPDANFSSVTAPSNDPSATSTIVRADTYENMIAFTDQYPDSCTGAQGRCAIFYGRTVMLPEISIRVNDQQRYVPIGTSLQHLVEQSVMTVNRPRTLSLQRYINGVATAVLFEDDTIGFNLPLVQGDNIKW